MAVFNTIEELVEILDDNPQWIEALAKTAAIRQAPGIAADMGFNWTRTLSMHHLLRMIANGDTSGIDPIDLRKFRNADLIIEAVDAQDKTHYIAVEISYTADARDTDRAIMFARFLKKFTTCDAHAAIAALSIDNRIRNITQSGDVFWYRLEEDDLEVR